MLRAFIDQAYLVKQCAKSLRTCGLYAWRSRYKRVCCAIARQAVLQYTHA
jgi:hypothetical protein